MLTLAFTAVHLSRSEYDYSQCKNSNSKEEYCSTYKMPFGVFERTGDFFDTHSGSFSALSGIAVAYFTWILYQVTKRLWIVGRDQGDLARAEFIANQRPWVSVSIAATTDLSISSEQVISLDVGVKFKNHGTTPALGLSFFIKLIPYSRDIMYQTHKVLGKHTVEMSKSYGPSLFPNQETTRYTQLTRPDVLVGSMTEPIHPTDRWVTGFVVGTVSYRFAFGGTGQTDFCFMLAQDIPSGMVLFDVGYAVERADGTVPKANIILAPMGGNAR